MCQDTQEIHFLFYDLHTGGYQKRLAPSLFADLLIVASQHPIVVLQQLKEGSP